MKTGWDAKHSNQRTGIDRRVERSKRDRAVKNNANTSAREAGACCAHALLNAVVVVSPRWLVRVKDHRRDSRAGGRRRRIAIRDVVGPQPRTTSDLLLKRRVDGVEGSCSHQGQLRKRVKRCGSTCKPAGSPMSAETAMPTAGRASAACIATRMVAIMPVSPAGHADSYACEKGESWLCSGTPGSAHWERRTCTNRNGSSAAAPAAAHDARQSSIIAGSRQWP